MFDGIEADLSVLFIHGQARLRAESTSILTESVMNSSEKENNLTKKPDLVAIAEKVID
ncbi:MAG: hypothetical protein WBM44_27545 [Waterburya sp.]